MARRSSKKIPDIAVEAEIERFAHDGRGVTHVDGRVIFVDGGLPGERVEFEYTALKRDFAEARVLRVLEASPLRSEPKCGYFGICGACSFQHVDPEKQIFAKQEILADQFRRIGKIDEIPFWPPIRGPLWGYRHKARLGVKYVAKKQRVLVGFREKASRFLADMDHCEVLHPIVGQKLKDLAELIEGLSIHDRIPQIEAAIGDSGCVLVFRNLVEASPEDLQQLREFGCIHGFSIFLQPKGPDSLFSVDECEPRLLSYSLPGHGVTFHFKPLQFTQVNVEINRRMVDRAIELLDPRSEDRIIDLFCGIGNFTLPIARHAKHVVGVEGSAELIAQARQNAKANGIDNTEFRVADLSSDVSKEDWCQAAYDKVLLDPSRAGAEAILHQFPIWGVKRIVYISCNPATLARDSGVLTRELGYRIEGAGVMDMFPQTSHVESIALFEKD